MRVRPKRARGFLLAVVGAAAAACGLSVTGDGAPGAGGDAGNGDANVSAPDAPGGTGPDGASPETGPRDARSADDGALDAVDEGDTADAFVCVPIDADAGVLGNLDLGTFELKGNAKFDENSDHILTLTNSNNGENGAAWWPQTLPAISAATLSFDVRVGPGDTGGDGVAFAILRSSSEPNVGNNGDAIGLDGIPLPGFAVVVDMYKTAGDPTDDDVTTLKLVTMPAYTVLAHAGIGDALNDGNTHAVDVVLAAGGMLSATLHGPANTVTISHVDPGFVSSAPAYFGFTGSTGGSANSHNEIAALRFATACK